MDELKIEYERVNNEIKDNAKELTELEKDEKIIRYKSLSRRNELLCNYQIELYKKLKQSVYENCNHIFICSKIDYNAGNGRSYRNYACIKCGLDNSILDCDREFLSLDKQIMYDYLHNGINYKQSRITNIVFDLNLAQELYRKIISTNPGINDDEAIALLEDEINVLKTPKENHHTSLSRIYTYSKNIKK